MQVMLDTPRPPQLKSVTSAEYTIKKKKIGPLDNSQKLHRPDTPLENKQNNSSINSKRSSPYVIDGKKNDFPFPHTSPFHEKFDFVSSFPLLNPIEQDYPPTKDPQTTSYFQPKAPNKKVKTDEPLIISKPNPSNFTNPGMVEESKINKPVPKPGFENHFEPSGQNKSRSREYDQYSQRPKPQKVSAPLIASINLENVVFSKTKLLPHVKLTSSMFGNVFIPVLPSFLTDF
jgi:hypothetical protein